MNMATRLFSAAESQLDLDLDGDEPVDGEESGEAGPSSVVDFSLLPTTTLMRYVQTYKIAVPPECEKARLVAAVEEHFCGTVVDEVVTGVKPVHNLLRAPTDTSRPPGSARWSAPSCVPMAARTTTVAARTSGSTARGGTSTRPSRCLRPPPPEIPDPLRICSPR